MEIQDAGIWCTITCPIPVEKPFLKYVSNLSYALLGLIRLLKDIQCKLKYSPSDKSATSANFKVKQHVQVFKTGI